MRKNRTMKIQKVTTGLLLLLTASVFFACNNFSNIESGISGTIEGAEGETIYLQRFVNNKAVVTDSALINNKGQFLIQPENGLELNFYKLMLSNDQYIVLVTDSTEHLSIETSADNFEEDAQVKGSHNTCRLLDFHRSLTKKQEKLIELKAQTNNPKLTDDERQLAQKQLIEIAGERRQECLKFIDDELPSPAVLAALSELDVNRDKDHFIKVKEGLKSNFSHTYYYKMVDQQIQKTNQPKQERQQPNTKYGAGMEAPQISMQNPKGETMNLSDLRGKVVMIDFWASWCGPCRRENPHVVEAYKKYNKEGFEVFSVSLDKQVDKWEQAIEKDGLLWPYHVSDLLGWQNAAAQNYGVSSIPHTVLVGRDGKIIATHLRGSALSAQLSEIFGH